MKWMVMKDTLASKSLLLSEQPIIKINSRRELDLTSIVKRSYGSTGADLKHIVNEAAMLAVRENSKMVLQRHLEASYEKFYLGLPQLRATNKSNELRFMNLVMP